MSTDGLQGGPAHEGEHPSVELLADHDAGITVDAWVLEHLAGCERCQDVVVELAELRAALADRPERTASGAAVDPPAPDWVRARIETALRQEREQPGSATGSGSASGDIGNIGSTAVYGGTDTPRRRSWAPKLLVAAMGIGIVAVGGYTVGQGNPPDDTTAGMAELATSDAAEEQAGDPDTDAGPDAGDDTADSSAGTFSDETPEAGAAPGLQSLRAADPDEAAAVLTESIRAIEADRTQAVPQCGAELAAERSGELLGSTVTDADTFLVVVREDDDALTGWLLPSCDALPPAAELAVTLPG